MAAPTESLLSLRHLTDTERNAFTKPRGPSVKKRPMLFENEFSTPTSLGNLRVMHLQRRWQELQEREHVAQQHNRQLLQKFEKAQDALEDMLARNAAMKTIRIEYERYLEDNSQRWQEQLEAKTQAAQKKKMEDYLRSYLKKEEEEQVPKHTADKSLLSQGPSTSSQKNVATQVHSTQEYSDYNHDSFPHHPYIQSWLTHAEPPSGRFHVRVPYQPHSSSLFLPPNFPQPHPFLLHHLTSPPSHQNPWPRNNTAGWASSQQPYPWPWASSAAGIPPGSWGQLYTDEPSPELRVSQTRGEEDETSRAQSTKRERSGGSRSRRLSQELDIKPVRLSSSHAESSGSGRDSSLTSREKRKKREKSGKTHQSSSDRERCNSRESSRISSKSVTVSGAVSQSVERDTSSEDGSTRSNGTKRSRGLSVGSSRSEKVAREQTKTDEALQSHKEESQKVKTHTGEESGSSSEESVKEKEGNQGHDDKPGSRKAEGESESDGIEIVTGATDEAGKQDSSSSEQSSTEEKDGERNKNLEGGEHEEKEYSQKSEEQEESHAEEEDDDDDVSGRKNATEEEVEKAVEDNMEDQSDDEEQSNNLKNKHDEKRKEDSSSSQDEDVDEGGSEGSEDKMDEEEEEGSNEEGDGESEKEEEHKHDEAHENTDSDDSIISPQEKSSQQREIIPEKAAEDEEDNEEDSEMRSPTDHSSQISDEDDDVENLLAPQVQNKMEKEKDVEADKKTKEICHNVDIFQVTEDRLKTDQQSDSDEFDHFYD